MADNEEVIKDTSRMANFHICHPGHKCGTNKTVSNLVEVGTRFVFAVNQFRDSVAETLTVRTAQGA